MVDAVLFDLDETLLDRTNSLKAFLRDQFEQHADHLGHVRSNEWWAQFLVLDRRGHVHKSVVYERIRPLAGTERRALPHFVSLAEVRALLFLAEFCILAGDLWPHVLDQATNLLDRELIF